MSEDILNLALSVATNQYNRTTASCKISTLSKSIIIHTMRNVGINRFGRIGRLVFRAIVEQGLLGKDIQKTKWSPQISCMMRVPVSLMRAPASNSIAAFSNWPAGTTTSGAIPIVVSILQSLPTTKLLRARGAKVILLAHFGRPKGKPPADLFDIVWPFCVNMHTPFLLTNETHS